MKIPYELMKFEWDVARDTDFCLNRNKCILDTMDIDRTNNLCFSFNNGGREIIYVKDVKRKKPNKTDTKANALPKADPKTDHEKKCLPGKAINPLTGRCVFLKNLNKLPKNQLSHPEKVCPEGKVINPLTGRCIKIKTKK